MKDDCAFCGIAQGDKEADIVYQDEQLTAFHDIAPQAPTHIVIIPNQHVPSLRAVDEGDEDVLGAMIVIASEIAEDVGVSEGGYRLVVNTGEDAGQSVPHLHLHLLGGRQMRWPPG